MGDLGALVVGSFQRAPWGWALLGTVVLALIKVWPILSLQVIQARAKIRSEDHEELTSCRGRLDAMEVRVTAAEGRAHQFEMRLMGTLQAYRILDIEVNNYDPDSSALAQARACLSTAFATMEVAPDDMEDLLARAH